MAKKILVAMDESKNALRSAEFVGKFFQPDASVTLFSVLLDTEAMCAMQSPELIPYFKTQQTAFCSLEDKKKELVIEALEKAKATLVNHGFDETRITTRTVVRDRGIARDIIKEIKSGEYDLVVLGKQGLSAIKDFILGSTTQKVIHGAGQVSVLLVE